MMDDMTLIELVDVVRSKPNGRQALRRFAVQWSVWGVDILPTALRSYAHDIILPALWVQVDPSLPAYFGEGPEVAWLIEQGGRARDEATYHALQALWRAFQPDPAVDTADAICQAVFWHRGGTTTDEGMVAYTATYTAIETTLMNWINAHA